MKNLNEYILKNCTLISMDKSRTKVEENIDIWIKKDKIFKIDTHIIVKGIKTFNMTGKIVMPGFINAHSHMPMSIFRETIDGYGLQSWLTEKVFKMEAKLDNKDIYTATLISCLEAIKTGTTTVNNMYFAAKSTSSAFKKCKIRVMQTQHLLDIDGKGKENISLFRELMKARHSSLEVRAIGTHSFYTISPKYLKEVNKLIEEFNLPIHIHFCENEEEVATICKIHKVENPVDLLEKYRNKKLILAHCVALSSAEIMRISKFADANIVFNPVSNLKLGCGIAKIHQMQKHKINVCLGTDGQGSGSNLDMFETMKLAALIIKGYYKDPMLMPSYEVLKMATINGAKALGLEDKIGSIEEGKQADLIVLDLNKIITSPINNIFAQLVYNAKGTDVEMTIINGEILYIKGKYLVLDEEKELIVKANEIIERITE